MMLSIASRLNAYLNKELQRFCPYHAAVSVGASVRDDLKALHKALSRGTVDPDNLSNRQQLLLAHEEFRKILAELIKPVLDSMKGEAALQRNSENLAYAQVLVKKTVNKVWRPLFEASRQINKKVVGDESVEPSQRDIESPFRYIREEYRNKIGHNLQGEFKTGLDFVERMLTAVVSLSIKEGLDEKSFWELAYQTAPLLDQFARLDKRFLAGRNGLIQGTLPERLKLGTGPSNDLQLYYNVPNIEKDLYLKGVISSVGAGIMKLAEKVNRLDAADKPDFIFRPTQNCPAQKVRFSRDDISDKLLPSDFRHNFTKETISLVDLLLLQYLYFLRLEIGGRFDELVNRQPL